MKNWKTRLLALGLVAMACASVGVLGRGEASAQPCCSSCDPTYNRCVTACAGDRPCLQDCQDRNDFCWSHCSNC